MTKFTSKARRRALEHIVRKTFENYNGSTRQKRSHLMQIDKDIRAVLDLDNNRFSIKKLTDAIKVKRISAVEQYPKECARLHLMRQSLMAVLEYF